MCLYLDANAIISVTEQRFLTGDAELARCTEVVVDVLAP
jgi:hypothetical protein